MKNLARKAMKVTGAVVAVSVFFASLSSLASETVPVRRTASEAPQGIPAPAAPVQKYIPGNVAALRAEERSGDYLNHIQAPPSERPLSADIFDKAITDEMASRYENISKDLERKQTYNLDRREDHIRFEQANKDLADWTMKRMVQFHTENSMKKTSESKNSNGGSSAVGSTVSAVRAIQNSTFKFGEETKAKFKYNLPNGTMNLGMVSPVFNTTLEYRTRPITGKSVDDSLSVSADKQIKDLSASARANYGVYNGILNYGVSKHIAGPVSAGVDQVQNTKDHSRNETIGRVHFGTSF